MARQDITTDDLVITRGALPHWQIGGRSYFVTFRSIRGELSPAARDVIVEVIRRGEGSFFLLRLGVVMPDHVHLVLLPLQKEKGIYHDLGRILGSIKSKSCQLINRLEGRTGDLWQHESYDHMIRCINDHDECFDYIQFNPVKAGLAKDPIDYPWLFLGTKQVPDHDF